PSSVLLLYLYLPFYYFFFFFTDTAPTEIYTLSLHDALPISSGPASLSGQRACRSSSGQAIANPRIPRSPRRSATRSSRRAARIEDRKSTRLNSSHVAISYAVFCLKKKKKKKNKIEVNTTRVN